MPQEIERKFLVKGDFKNDTIGQVSIVQGYLSSVAWRRSDRTAEILQRRADKKSLQQLGRVARSHQVEKQTGEHRKRAFPNKL